MLNVHIVLLILVIIKTWMFYKVRGDPDGCGLDLSLRYSPSSELRVDLPNEDLLNIKKGWLMKQGSTSDVSFKYCATM